MIPAFAPSRKAMSEPNEQPDYDAFTKQLIEQYNEIAQLAGALAHEIKNPLSVIRMNVDLLTEDFTDEEPVNRRRALQKIQIVQRQCERLQNLLNDFLKFARVRQLDLTPGSLNEQMERVLDLFEAQATNQQVDILRYLDPALPSIMLDEQTLEAALVNLVKNAIEAMPDGGQLTARTRETRIGVALDLIDTGCGMDQNTAIHMFDAFYSTKDGGSGLGLPTAKKVIEAHGARIDVQSVLGRGTKFTLEFPTPARLQGTESAA
jgi:signal transduction histidine kinase